MNALFGLRQGPASFHCTTATGPSAPPAAALGWVRTTPQSCHPYLIRLLLGLARAGKDRYVRIATDAQRITRSNVPMKHASTDAHPTSDTDRRQPLSHVHFQKPAARHYKGEKRHQ
eukprot:1998884-Pyramimonas_sp.AAC.1